MILNRTRHLFTLTFMSALWIQGACAQVPPKQGERTPGYNTYIPKDVLTPEAIPTRIAVAELLRRDRASSALDPVTLELIGPQPLTGASVAKIWSSALGREITYGGDDVTAFEGQLASYGPNWLAYDMSLMMAGIQTFGMQAAEGTAEQLQALIGHPLRTYEDFVRESVAGS